MRGSWRRRLAAGFLLVLVSGVVGAALLWPSGDSLGSGPYSFPHHPHLRSDTVDAALREAVALQAGRGRPGGGGTVDADCRVCHDFSKGPDAHLGGCDACHVSSKHLEVERRAGGTGSSTRPFPHVEHLRDPSVTCFSCHRAQMEEDWVEFSVPPPGMGGRGRAGRPGGPLGEFTCADCHADHEPRGGLVKQDETTGDGKTCETCHMGAASILPLRHRAGGVPGGVRPFRHRDHGGSGAACEECHTGIRESRSIWDYDPTLSTAEKCAACHVSDADGTSLIGLADPARETRVPFVAFSNFSHAAHLDPAGRVETTGGITAGCRTCHFPETDPGGAGKTFPGVTSQGGEPISRWAIGAYPTCLPCHGSWRVENHGTGEWACFKCHGAATDASDKLEMARVPVERDHIAAVRFARHHHPGITTRGAELRDASQPGGKECRDCHKGEIDEISSRLFALPFRHDPHLPQSPVTEDCLACHTSTVTTSWSEDLRRFDAHIGGVVPPGARSCFECHAGAKASELGIARRSRVVPQFDHRSHVNAESYSAELPGIPCTECHERGGALGYTVPADVADCKRCHGHDESDLEKFSRTGPSGPTGAAGNCLPCHEEVWPRGKAPHRRGVVRTHLDLLPGVQWHDKGGDCVVCHERDAFAGQPARYVERITSARTRGSIHDDPELADRWFNDPGIAGAAPPARSCKTCHRRDPRGYLRRLGGGR